ncbi:MAG: sigmaK-factor processing regulatory BofA [Candidatus Diapherotrites archaeon]|uniref:SigmaK-factor processing regulatory BofA n=1 Tax=Candidatus Iainarchaeum sp. TaxID=3101447 RepID=A0A2D6LQ58_9ARCH|nr:sigmaK-factor processing regulatory BofA [Candidatus Diapherotrites archaeon]|tara:strand:- start:11148 stop:11408 length:261 start_codon:yes stop_codon:yes gene_type:complete
MALDPILGFVLTAIVVIIAIFFALKLGKKIVILLINSFIGLVVLVLLNFFPFIHIEINIWSVLITAFGGIPGIILLILLDLLGFAF